MDLVIASVAAGVLTAYLEVGACCRCRTADAHTCRWLVHYTLSCLASSQPICRKIPAASALHSTCGGAILKLLSLSLLW